MRRFLTPQAGPQVAQAPLGTVNTKCVTALLSKEFGAPVAGLRVFERITSVGKGQLGVFFPVTMSLLGPVSRKTR